MKQILLILVLLVFQLSGFSQKKIGYDYDLAGNRKSTIILKSATIPKDTTKVAFAVNPNEEKIEFNETLGEQEIKIYPNPTRGELKLTISNLVEGVVARLFVYNSAGALVFQKENLSTSNEINLSEQISGMYIMRIVLGDKTSEWKIIKQ